MLIEHSLTQTVFNVHKALLYTRPPKLNIRSHMFLHLELFIRSYLTYCPINPNNQVYLSWPKFNPNLKSLCDVKTLHQILHHNKYFHLILD